MERGQGDSGGGRLFGVMVTCARPQQLRRSLELLERSHVRPERLLVLDNAPSERGAAVPEAHRELQIDYIAALRNLGPAGGRALAVERILEYARDDDWVAFFDDDEPLPGPTVLGVLFERARTWYSSDPTAAAVGLAGARFDRRRALNRRAPSNGAPYTDVDNLHGWGFPLYRAGPLRSVGSFDARLFYGFEELDLGLRLTDAGFRLQVHEALAASLRDRFGRPGTPGPSRAVGPATWKRYYALRNSVAIARRTGGYGAALRVAVVRGLAKPVANLPVRPRLAAKHLASNTRAVRDALTGRLGCTVLPDLSGRTWDRRGVSQRPAMLEPGRDAAPRHAGSLRARVVDLYLDDRVDSRTAVRLLAADGVALEEARLLVRSLAPRVMGPLTRWGPGAPVDAGDFYADAALEDEKEMVATGRATPNWTRGRSGQVPDGIVVHTTHGSARGAVSWFGRASSEVSAHYVVTLDGAVLALVDEGDAAHHAGRVRRATTPLAQPGIDPNLHTIGVEFEDRGEPLDARRSEAQYRAGARLLAEIATRWGIPIDSDRVVGHRELNANKLCPGGLDIARLRTGAAQLASEWRPWRKAAVMGHARPRLVCLMPVRNAASDLPGVLDAVARACDAVVALDDGSTDGSGEVLAAHPAVHLLLRNPPRPDWTGWHDGANRNRLVRAAAELDPDWVVFIDADERLGAVDARRLRRLVDGDPDPEAAYGFRHVRMWGERSCDPAESWVYRLFAHGPDVVLPTRRLHFDPVPLSIPRERRLRTGVRLQHFGAASPERQALRRTKYLAADPEGRYRNGTTLDTEPATVVPWTEDDSEPSLPEAAGVRL